MRTGNDLKSAFDSVWNETVDVLPTVAIGLLILLGGWLLAKLMSVIVFKILNRYKDSKLSRAFSIASLNDRFATSINIPTIVSKLVYWTIFLFAVVAASETFGWSNVSKEISIFIHYIPRLLSALLIFIIGYSLARFVRDAVRTATQSMEIGIGRVSGDILFYFLVLLVSITALAQAGIDTTMISSHMYILIGALCLTFAIAFGWGAREVVSDLLKNFYNRNVLQQGDKIEYNGETGVIEKITKTSVIYRVEDVSRVVPAKDFYASSYSIQRLKKEA
jgi:hypothetical protein